MPRYIDADYLEKRLNVSPAFQNFGQDGFFLREVVLNILDGMPTADVVPKSEVEELKADLEVWKQNRFNIFQMLELYKMTRQEAARGIFEEINSLRDEYSQGDIEYPDFQFRLGKIEKNYTEGE